MKAGAAVLALVLVALSSPAIAHPAPFSYLDFRITSDGLDGTLTVHDFDVAHDLGIDPPEALHDPVVAAKYREQLTRLMQSRLAITIDGRRVEPIWEGLESLPERQSVRLPFRIDGTRPAALHIAAVLFPYDPVHQTFINVYEDGSLRHQAILDAGRQSADYYAGSWQGTMAVLAIFIPAGIEHILIGPDHVLFLVGLLLLGGPLWRLATIVTAFTIGHSMTLSLAALDIVSPSASLVEPIIALSIVFVGADNLLVQRDATAARRDAVAAGGRPRDIRMWIAGVFGLVHGFGFASVLKEFGLPATALGWSLFSFNAGVEIGQLVIVAVVAVALRAISTANPGLSRRLVIGGSVFVMAAGVYWFVERVFVPGGL